MSKIIFSRLATGTGFGFLLLSLSAVSSPDTGRETMQVIMHKNPSCMCCNAWAETLEENGFEVTIDESISLADVNVQHGVGEHVASCHTAVVDGYKVVGHVPVQEILRLLKERPGVEGISVPGMPVGSPGMEVEGAQSQAYDVVTFDQEGNTSIYARYQANGTREEP